MSEARCWLALLAEDGDCPGAVASALLRGPEGRTAGRLVAWLTDAAAPPPRPDARRADPRILDPAGAAAFVSLVMPPLGALVLFDDGAVQGARRAVLADAEPADALTTLLVDDRHFAGAITVRRGDDALRRLREDPFAAGDRGAARVLRVDAGLFGTSPASPGPTIERHGSGTPWPGGRF